MRCGYQGQEAILYFCSEAVFRSCLGSDLPNLQSFLVATCQVIILLQSQVLLPCGILCIMKPMINHCQQPCPADLLPCEFYDIPCLTALANDVSCCRLLLTGQLQWHCVKKSFGGCWRGRTPLSPPGPPGQPYAARSCSHAFLACSYFRQPFQLHDVVALTVPTRFADCAQ